MAMWVEHEQLGQFIIKGLHGTADDDYVNDQTACDSLASVLDQVVRGV